MASTPKQVNGETANNCSSGKRKKSRGNKGSYLSNWLDRTLHHIQESTPSMDTYDSFANPNMNCPNNAQFPPGYDPCRYSMYGCTPEPMSLPTLPTYYNPMTAPFYPDYRCMQTMNKSIQVQRPRQRRRDEIKLGDNHKTPKNAQNCMLSSNSYLQPKNYSDSQDFASLPPIVTSVGDTASNTDMNANEKDDGSNARRYSDPCVQALPDVARPANGDVDSASEASTGFSGSQVGSRLLSCLLDQITTLKMANERLNKELQDTKAELNIVRQQNSIWQQAGEGISNIGAAPNHAPFTNNGIAGGQYSPGFLTDLVREIRDAARMREEALYARVRAMVIEKTDNGMASSEWKFNEKTLDEIKSSLRASEADKRRMMDRIVKLEDELRVLRVASGLESNDKDVTNGIVEDTEAECVRLRKELTNLRKAKQTAEDHTLKLERLVTQLRSKFNGVQASPNGSDSLASEPEHDANVRTRRTSVNSTNNNSTVVFGPVTDL